MTPWYACRSVPHMPLARMRIRTWPGCGRGSGSVLMVHGFLTSVITAARMATLLGHTDDGRPPGDSREQLAHVARRDGAERQQALVEGSQIEAAGRAPPRLLHDVRQLEVADEVGRE